jgi:hypothetical protein
MSCITLKFTLNVTSSSNSIRIKIEEEGLGFLLPRM